jgi:hypothetical protein
MALGFGVIAQLVARRTTTRRLWLIAATGYFVGAVRRLSPPTDRAHRAVGRHRERRDLTAWEACVRAWLRWNACGAVPHVRAAPPAPAPMLDAAG